MSKKLNQYAVVMTATSGMLPGVNAFANGLDYYDNRVDFYLVGDEKIEKYVEEAQKVPDFKVNFFFKSIEQGNKDWPVPPERKSGWQVRFFHYKEAIEIGEDYDSVMIVDADMLCLNNLMPYFRLAHDSKWIILPTNPWGMKLENILEFGTSGLKGASSPPYHNMPLFLDVKEWKWFLEEIWKNGLANSYGDMVNVSRTIIDNKLYLDKVLALQNQLWILSTFYLEKIKIEKLGGKEFLMQMEEKINTVHRRWWDNGVCKKFISDIDDKKTHGSLDKAKNNVKLFWSMYKKFNQNHKIKIDWPFNWYEDNK